FTALLILRLHDRGLLSVEDDVRQYLPELPAYRKNQPIRVRDLLNHVSGLPEYFDMERPPLPPGRRHWTNEDYVPAFAAQRKTFPLTFAPGEKYAYCNSNYLLLGAVAGRVGKKSFGRLVHEEIFRPLGMTSSFVYERPGPSGKPPAEGHFPALGYRRAKAQDQWRPSWGGPPPREGTVLVGGDGGVWSSLEDLEKWDTALRAGKLLKPQTLEAALTPSRTRDGQTNDYGYGWGLYQTKAGKSYGYGHDGDWSGFRTSYYRHLTTNRR